jgi:hypothetical protein
MGIIGIELTSLYNCIQAFSGTKETFKPSNVQIFKSSNVPYIFNNAILGELLHPAQTEFVLIAVLL